MAEQTAQQNLEDDYLAEDEFRKSLTSSFEEKIETELASMIKVYNEQIEKLARIRTDVEFFNVMRLIDPNGGGNPQDPGTWGQKYDVGTKLIAERRVIIGTLRRHILERVKRQNGKA